MRKVNIRSAEKKPAQFVLAKWVLFSRFTFSLETLKDFMGFYKLAKDAFFPPLLNKPGSASHCSSSLSIFLSFGLFCGLCLQNLSSPSCSAAKASSSSFSFPSWALICVEQQIYFFSASQPWFWFFFFHRMQPALTYIQQQTSK